MEEGLTDMAGTGDPDTGTGAEGGDLVAPLIAAGLALGTVYAVGKTYDDYRYWVDYHRNTGHLPRYPFRSGMGDAFHYGSGLSYGYYKVFQ